MENQRIRDPIHGLITFDPSDNVDAIACKIIDTPEFQRLRHIRQLGVSEFVFPGATHTRFAHSIGVFHNARILMRVIEKEEKTIDQRRRMVALLAALVHDLGHGPFSHAFEVAREKIATKRGNNVIEKHESFSAKMIIDSDSEIKRIFDKVDKKLADEVADLIKADNPIDIYHAVVSSSFDADRMDYLVRDRHMTGIECGSIDSNWLIDNLTTHKINLSQDDDEPQLIPTFVFKSKGRQAAEDFLLARYRLYSQLYLHKTTRGFEQIIGALLEHIADNANAPTKIGLRTDNPFVIFLKPNGENLKNYIPLNDDVFWATVRSLSKKGDNRAKLLANRLLSRERLKVLDLTAEYGDDPALQAAKEQILDQHLNDKLNKSVFKDTAPNHLYKRAGGEVAKTHKKVRVLNGHGDVKEILEFPDTIISNWLTKKRDLVRYYFLNENDRTEAARKMRGR